MNNGYYSVIEFKDLVVATMLKSGKRLINFDDVRATKDAVEHQLKAENTVGIVKFNKEEMKDFKRKFRDVFTVGNKSIQLNSNYSREYLIEHFVSFLPIQTMYWLGYINDENLHNNKM